jgi:Family of unknown function (DUF695)
MPGDENEQIWAIAESVQKGRKTIFRYAETLSPSLTHASHPVQITIVWLYQSENDQPVKEEYDRMVLLEEKLDLVIEQDCFAALALVATGEGSREWTYYAKSEDEFLSRLNSALAGMPRFPIEIHIEQDSDWTVYTQFMARVRKSMN